MKKILIFTPHFYPENPIINDLVLELNEEYKFIIVTSFPNYPDRKLFKKYKPWLHSISRQFKNITIIRLPVIYRKGNNNFFLFCNYISYIFSSLLITPVLFFFNFHRIFVFLTSPFSITISPLILNFFKKTPMSIWVLDLWPETLEAFTFPFKKPLIKFIHRYTQIFYSRCKNIFISSEGFSKSSSLIKFNDKISFIPQWRRNIIFSSKNYAKLSINKNDNDFIILFAGNMGRAQNFENIFFAINELKGKNHIKWVFLGDGSEKKWLEERVSKEKIKNVYFYGYVPINDTDRYYKIADANLISLIDSEAINYVLPAKLQHCLGYGKPILSFASGEISKFVLKNNIGLSANSEDYSQLCKNIIKIKNYSKKDLDLINDNCKKLLKTTFNKEKIIDQIKQKALN